MPNEIKSVRVDPNPIRSKARAMAVVTYEKDGDDILHIHPSEGFRVDPQSVQLINLDRQPFSIVFERSQQTHGSTCEVLWTLGHARFLSHVEVLPAAPGFELIPERRSLRDGGSVVLKVRHAPGAGGRLKVLDSPSFVMSLQKDTTEQSTEASPLVESKAVLAIQRRPRTKGRYATVDFELDGERLSLEFTLEKP